jgi:hypothetical protein
MKRSLVTAAVSAAALMLALPAAADGNLAKFEGAIGVIPVSSGQGTAATATVVNRNIVRGVQPPGQIWVIAGLKAEVKSDGRIKVDGRGLLLGGGNNIGGNANQSVRAALFCGPGSTTAHTSGLVALEANGDFRIDDTLSPALALGPCESPVLLILNPAGSWFAAGIPK